MARPLCIYHKNCLDGNGAAAIVKRKEPDCEFLSMQYSHQPPTVLDRKVYIVDFGLSLEHMRALKAQASEVVWIDHHASQLSTHRALGWGVLDTSECGSTLTWKVLFGELPPPPVLAYIKDKDLWRWELPDSRAIAAGLSQTFPGDKFSGLLEADLAEMARIGRPLVEARNERVAKAVKLGTSIDAPYGMAGVRALVVNCNQDQNEVGDHICMASAAGGLGYDLAIIYYRKGTTGQWVHSLRASEGGRIDCATIADRRGGGGHPSSACYLSPIQFLHSLDCPPEARLRPPPAVAPAAPI
jgi:hypothetical protein